MNYQIRIATSVLVVLFFSFFTLSPVKAQLTVNATPTAVQLANLLTGPGVSISNISRTCPGGASGSFNGTASTIGLPSGVLLTSGSVNIAAQPNIGGAEGTDNFAAGDMDLNTIGGQFTFDACILEFDLVATCDTISISYVFGSEEYDEFVCAGVNDVFAFIIDGPGLNNVNIATVPTTNDPVTINTVNNGTVGQFGQTGPGCILGNSAYYATNAGTSYEYDGNTIPMLAKSWVQPCSTYHIKLAIADGGDGIYDSGVFLEEGGIRCASAQIEVNTATLGNTNYIVEGCTDGLLYFTREGNLSTSFNLQYSIGGTATNGTDYPALSGNVNFPPGIDSVGLFISAPDDGLAEGPETIFIIINDSLCSVMFSDTASFLIVDPPNAEFTFQPACLGSPTPFFNTSTFYGTIASYEWDFGDGGTSTLQNPTHSYLAQGNYTAQLIIETSEGCRDTFSVNITALESPTAAFTASSFCIGFPTVFTDGSSQTPPGQVTGWNWDFGDGGLSTAQNPSHAFPAPGTYNVQLISTNGAGCTDTIVQAIDIFANPQPDFSWTDVCQGGAMTFTDQTTLAQGSISLWVWDFGDGAATVLPNPSHTYADTGTYTVQLIVSSDQGCIDSVSHDVQVFSNPIPDFEVSFACLGDTSYFTDLSTIDEGTIASWDWNFGDGGTSSDQNPSHLYTNPGNFTITLTVTSDQGCITVFREIINRPPRPDRPIVQHDTICQGESAYLQALPATPGDVVHWYYTPQGTAQFQIGTDFDTPPLGDSRPWFVAALSDKGCWSEQVPIWAIVEGPPQLSFQVSSYEVEIPDAIVEFNLFDPATVSTFLWQFGDGGTSTAAQPVYQYQAPGSYLVTLDVEGPNGCATTYTLGEVVVIQNIRLFVPNAFSPNGDGLNDFFQVETRLIKELEISIYDRWGKLTYNSRDLNFEWPGVDATGQPLPEGAYAYKIRAIGFDNSVIERAGTVLILK